MIGRLLAVWKAGGAYVPVDPEYPAERIRFMVEDAKCVVVITQGSLSQSLPSTDAPILILDTEQNRFDTRPGDQVQHSLQSPEKIAYIIYTSGSTGHPKGVPITHASLFNLICWHHQAYHLTPADRDTQVAGPAFDASVWHTWPYLTVGARVHIPDNFTP